MKDYSEEFKYKVSEICNDYKQKIDKQSMCDMLKNLASDFYSKQFEDALDEILEDFDFGKCQKVMKALNWCWNGNLLTPAIDEMKSKVIELAQDCKVKADLNIGDPCTTSSGGFEVDVEKFAPVERKGMYVYYIEVKFVATNEEIYSKPFKGQDYMKSRNQQRPKEGDTYYFIGDDTCVYEQVYKDSYADNMRVDSGNCFPTAEAARVFAQKFFVMLQQNKENNQ